MTTWSKDELRKITEADDLHIAPFREDGMTYGTPTWIWSVAVDDALYMRGYNGQKSRWYGRDNPTSVGPRRRKTGSSPRRSRQSRAR
jgi:hypothetical protein